MASLERTHMTTPSNNPRPLQIAGTNLRKLDELESQLEISRTQLIQEIDKVIIELRRHYRSKQASDG